jgi:hypothetical protein
MKSLHDGGATEQGYEALPVTPSDDDIDLNDEDTDTVDAHPVATDRHPHYPPSTPGN